MRAIHVTRRGFLKGMAAVGLVTAAGCFDAPAMAGNGMIAFRRSGRGLRISNAAKKNNANKLYATATAAAADLAHPGDNSKVVQVIIPRQQWAALFGDGSQIADLRKA